MAEGKRNVVCLYDIAVMRRVHIEVWAMHVEKESGVCLQCGPVHLVA